METGERKIVNITFAFMVVVAALFDLVQFLLEFLVIGWAVNWAISILAWLTLFVWFKMKGVNFVSTRRALALGGGFLIELIPVLNDLPVWTAAVIIIVMSDRAEEMANKGGLTGAVAQTAVKTLRGASNVASAVATGGAGAVAQTAGRVAGRTAGRAAGKAAKTASGKVAGGRSAA